MSKRDLLALVGFLVLSFGAAGFGALFTTPAVKAGGWYSQIRKPSWTPPSWLFGPVWAVLYLMMAVAGWWVWRPPLAVGGTGRHLLPLGRHPADDRRLFPRLAARGVADGALPSLGELRVGAQLYDLAAEWIGANATADRAYFSGHWMPRDFLSFAALLPLIAERVSPMRKIRP